MVERAVAKNHDDVDADGATSAADPFCLGGLFILPEPPLSFLGLWCTAGSSSLALLLVVEETLARSLSPDCLRARPGWDDRFRRTLLCRPPSMSAE